MHILHKIYTLSNVVLYCRIITFFFALSKPGVGSLFITVGRIGYSHLCRGPQKKLIMLWTVSETISLTQKLQLIFTLKRIISLAGLICYSNAGHIKNLGGPDVAHRP
jgi:hypothetical protein